MQPLTLSDRSAEQAPLHHLEADDLLGQPLRKGLHQEEEQVVSERNTRPVLFSDVANCAVNTANNSRKNKQTPFIQI